MKHYKRELEKTEMRIFSEKFGGKHKRYGVEANALGVIISIDSDDKEIIAFAKELGLKQDE